MQHEYNPAVMKLGKRFAKRFQKLFISEILIIMKEEDGNNEKRNI